jgi:hypothetical protein
VYTLKEEFKAAVDVYMEALECVLPRRSFVLLAL